MPATVSPATFPSGSVFTARHVGIGPYQSSAGSHYVFLRNSANTARIYAYKSTNAAANNFTEAASLAIPTSSAEALATYQVGDVIHLVCQISTGAVYYNQFNMATDAYVLGAWETAVAAAAQAPTAGSTFVSLVVRSNGNVVIAYNAGQTAMSSTFNMCRYRERTGTNTYGTATNFDNGGSVSWLYPTAVLGASNRVHFFFIRDTATYGYYQRTLSAANALETFPAAIDTDASGIAGGLQSVSYVDGATTGVRSPFLRVSDSIGRVAKLDSADAPTVTFDSGVSGAAVVIASTQRQQTLAADGTTLHYLYSDSTTQDLWHDTNSGSGWGTDVEERDAATINTISANVYTRSGSKYLAMVVNDGGTLKYAEITLSATTTPIKLVGMVGIRGAA